jgi:hypothetical protein
VWCRSDDAAALDESQDLAASAGEWLECDRDDRTIALHRDGDPWQWSWPKRIADRDRSGAGIDVQTHTSGQCQRNEVLLGKQLECQRLDHGLVWRFECVLRVARLEFGDQQLGFSSKAVMHRLTPTRGQSGLVERCTPEDDSRTSTRDPQDTARVLDRGAAHGPREVWVGSDDLASSDRLCGPEILCDVERHTLAQRTSDSQIAVFLDLCDLVCVGVDPVVKPARHVRSRDVGVDHRARIRLRVDRDVRASWAHDQVDVQRPVDLEILCDIKIGSSIDFTPILSRRFADRTEDLAGGRGYIARNQAADGVERPADFQVGCDVQVASGRHVA